MATNDYSSMPKSPLISLELKDDDVGSLPVNCGKMIKMRLPIHKMKEN